MAIAFERFFSEQGSVDPHAHSTRTPPLAFVSTSFRVDVLEHRRWNYLHTACCSAYLVHSL